MIGYFFGAENEKQVLYIPRNLIVIEDREGFDINYYPDSIKAYDTIWNNKRYDLIGIEEVELMSEIQIDPDIVQAFSDCCFKNKHLEAHILAIMMFQITEKEVSKNGDKV